MRINWTLVTNDHWQISNHWNIPAYIVWTSVCTPVVFIYIVFLPRQIKYRRYFFFSIFLDFLFFGSWAIKKFTLYWSYIINFYKIVCVSCSRYSGYVKYNSFFAKTHCTFGCSKGEHATLYRIYYLLQAATVVNSEA